MSSLRPISLTENILASTQGGLNDLAQSATIGHTYLITNNTVNAFRVAFNRVGVHRDNDDYFSGCDIGVNMYCYIPHQTVVNVTGGPAIGIATAIPASFIPTTYTIADDVSSGPWSAPIRVRRNRVSLSVEFECQRILRRLFWIHRNRHRRRFGRLRCGTIGHFHARCPEHFVCDEVVRGTLRPGHLEVIAASDRHHGPAMGAVPAPET